MIHSHDYLRFTLRQSHAGTVVFRDAAPADASEPTVTMDWTVEVRPLPGCTELVRTFTAAVVGTLSRNLKSRLAEPGARVELRGPRGGGPPLGISLEKESWLGGVLVAHLADQRSVLAQTRELVRPWNWGRSEDEAGDSEDWSTGVSTATFDSSV